MGSAGGSTDEPKGKRRIWEGAAGIPTSEEGGKAAVTLQRPLPLAVGVGGVGG